MLRTGGWRAEPPAPLRRTSVRRLKSELATRDIPILMLTVTEEDIAAGVQAGADDYLIMPIQQRELVLRVRSLPHIHHEKLQLLQAKDLLGEHARVMSTLMDFAQRLCIVKDLNFVLDETVSIAAQLLCSRRVSIMLPDAEEKTLTIATSIGMDENVEKTVRVPVGMGTAGRVFLSGKPSIANTPEEHQSAGYDSQLFVSTPLMSIALSTAERAVGVLNVTERQGARPFTALELEYSNLVSKIAAAAIEDILSRKMLDDSRDSVVVALAKLAEYRDNDTGKHLDSVTEYALILAEELRSDERFRTQIDEQFLGDLQRTVPLHDIGKVAIPDHILLKPGKLTPQEMAIMKRHAEVGADAIRSVIQRAPGAGFLTMAEEVAHAHHEWYDGCGYPRGLEGENIPLAARITALADVYDAITTKRPYKDPMPHEQAVAIIRERCGSQFDPAVVAAFLRKQHAFADVAARLADEVFIPPGEKTPESLQRIVAREDPPTWGHTTEGDAPPPPRACFETTRRTLR